MACVEQVITWINNGPVREYIYSCELICNWEGQYGPCLVWGSGFTVAALHWWGKSAEVHILFRISFRILSVSSGRCFNRLLWIPSGPGARGLAFMIDRLKSLSERFVVDLSVVWREVNFHLLLLHFNGLECSTVVGGGVVCECCRMLISNIFGIGNGSTILSI